MKIMIPTNENTIDTTICPSFGRAPCFMMYDSETGTREFFTNEAADSAGGAGIAAAQSIADREPDALLTPRCGENAAKVLLAAHIPVYKTSGDSLDDNIRSYLAGNLSVLTETHPGFHHHGGR